MIEVGMEWQVIDTPIQLKEVSSIATPYANKLKLYAKDNGSGVSALYYKNDAGSEIGPLAAAVTTLDHGVLTGLTDDDHTIYALLAGRSGGQTLKGGTASGDDLTLMSTNHATKGHLLFGTSGYDEVNNRLGIGLTAPSFGIHVRGSSPGCHVASNRVAADAAGPAFIGMKARGSVGSEAVPQADDGLVQLVGQGYQGGSYTTQGDVIIKAAEAWTSTAKGSYIYFDTTPTGSTTVAERFRIGPAGQLGVGGANYGTSGQVLTSGGSSAAPSWEDSTGVDDHGALSGLGDDDHTIYALLAGRSGGQTLTGGTASGDNLTLRSTSHSTKGTVAIADLMTSNTERTFLLGTTKNAFLFSSAINCVQEIGGTFAPSQDFSSGLFISTEFNGSANQTHGILVLSVHSPTTGSGLITRGMLSYPKAQPANGCNIGRHESLEFGYATGDTSGTIDEAEALRIGGPSLGTLKPATSYGIKVDNCGASGITNAVLVQIGSASGAANNYDMGFDTVNTGAAGAYYGKVPVRYNGLTKYLHVFDA